MELSEDYNKYKTEIINSLTSSYANMGKKLKFHDAEKIFYNIYLDEMVFSTIDNPNKCDINGVNLQTLKTDILHKIRNPKYTIRSKTSNDKHIRMYKAYIEGVNMINIAEYNHTTRNVVSVTIHRINKKLEKDYGYRISRRGQGTKRKIE